MSIIKYNTKIMNFTYNYTYYFDFILFIERLF